MGRILKISSQRLIDQRARRRACPLGHTSIPPSERLVRLRTKKSGRSTTLTSGPAAMLHKVAPGLGGGLTKATPPKGQSTIRFAIPPTCRHAKAWPNSCKSTIRKRQRYSATFQTRDE